MIMKRDNEKEELNTMLDIEEQQIGDTINPEWVRVE